MDAIEVDIALRTLLAPTVMLVLETMNRDIYQYTVPLAPGCDMSSTKLPALPGTVLQA